MAEACSFIIASPAIVNGSYCCLCGGLADAPASTAGTLEVALWNGRNHRRVCVSCVTRHAIRLQRIVDEANGVQRREPTIDEILDQQEADVFDVVLMPRSHGVARSEKCPPAEMCDDPGPCPQPEPCN